MILLPVSKSEWRTPSQAQPKDVFGNESQTRFRVRAKLHDGFTVWRGWFDDREDFDAFLWAIALGNLNQSPELWRLPTPQWHPDIAEDVTFDFATVTFLTSTTGSNQTYTSPSDWNNASNIVETIGAGGSGGRGAGGSNGGASGGGGGGWSQITNFTFATPGTTTATYQLGTGGPSTSLSTQNSKGDGTAGGDTWFNAATLAGSSVGAKGGGPGVGYNSSVTVNGGAGGAAASGTGTTKKSGGRGGNVTSSGGGKATGGGGAAGSTADGNAGTDLAANGMSNGGAADNGGSGAGTAGTAAQPTGGGGGNGSEWDASHGSGGGGGGTQATGSAALTAGSGGNYGGGGGGVSAFSSTNRVHTSGAGRQGIIVVTYTPAVFAGGFNMPMLGM